METVADDADEFAEACDGNVDTNVGEMEEFTF